MTPGMNGKRKKNHQKEISKFQGLGRMEWDGRWPRMARVAGHKGADHMPK